MIIGDYPGLPVPVQTGWQCPVCGTVNAPWAPMCMGCPPKPKIVVSTTTQPQGSSCQKDLFRDSED